MSSSANRRQLDQLDQLVQQAERLVACRVARGDQVEKVVKALGSGSNDARPQLLALLEDPSIARIVHYRRIPQL